MEKEFYTDEFEQLLKERADEFSMYPSKRVWHSIYNNLHPSRRWPSVIMSLLLVSSLMFIGYLHTGENNISQPINNNAINKTVAQDITVAQTNNNKKEKSTFTGKQQQPVTGYDKAFEDVITNETDFYTYTIVRSNRPVFAYQTAPVADATVATAKNSSEINGKDLVQNMDTYIKSNKIFTDIAVTHKKNKPTSINPAAKNAGQDDLATNDLNKSSANTPPSPLVHDSNTNLDAAADEADKPEITKLNATAGINTLTTEDKAWLEDFALHNKPPRNKLKGRLSYQVYATPAVNYRKLTSKSKGSATAFATADINAAISQKPGLGIEAGAGLQYALAKRLQLKAGVQFNYTNYNINADQTNHPVLTTILLNDPTTGYSYAATRTSTTANTYNSTALKPVTLHNRTYQVSIPVGFAYKLSSSNNVEWFAGTTVQPTYVFGGNAHIISSDLKSYVSDPSSISTWNLNLGFETYMNFKLGGFNLQVGPQVRYQLYSTYRKNLALIEKPYAVGLKFGISKGF